MKTANRAGMEFRTGKGLPMYVWLCLAAMLAAQLITYYGTRLILPFLPVYRGALPLDGAIPLLPEWVGVYCLAYVSWAVSGLIILAQGKKRAYGFTAAFILSMFLSAIVFLAWPLTMDRPEIVGGGFFRDLLRCIYRADRPNNLCPSLHVLVSYLCWRGLWGCPGIPKWFKGFNLVFLILVCLSVVFVKQHLVIDILGGIIVGEAALQAARRLARKKK